MLLKEPNAIFRNKEVELIRLRPLASSRQGTSLSRSADLDNETTLLHKCAHTPSQRWHTLFAERQMSHLSIAHPLPAFDLTN